jgi:hypothetical protein
LKLEPNRVKPDPMLPRISVLLLALTALVMGGCPAKSGDDGASGPVPPADSPSSPESAGDAATPEPAADEAADAAAPEPADDEPLTRAVCEKRGGTVVGDIGDGAIHKPDYRCPSGEPPLGSIVPAQGEPIASEGAVCCPS